MKEIKIGRKKITVIEWGSFKVDGGILFGLTPMSVWSEQMQPDKENLITLSIRSLLIETKRKKILVDTGFGEKLVDNVINKYHIKQRDMKTTLTDLLHHKRNM